MNQYRRLLSLGFCFVLYAAVQIHAQPQYTVTDLGGMQPTGVNNHGVVVGMVFPVGGVGGGTVVIADGEVSYLPTAGFGAYAEAINDTVAG